MSAGVRPRPDNSRASSSSISRARTRSLPGSFRARARLRTRLELAKGLLGTRGRSLPQERNGNDRVMVSPGQARAFPKDGYAHDRAFLLLAGLPTDECRLLGKGASSWQVPIECEAMTLGASLQRRNTKE